MAVLVMSVEGKVIEEMGQGTERPRPTRGRKSLRKLFLVGELSGGVGN